MSRTTQSRLKSNQPVIISFSNPGAPNPRVRTAKSNAHIDIPSSATIRSKSKLERYNSNLESTINNLAAETYIQTSHLAVSKQLNHLPNKMSNVEIIATETTTRLKSPIPKDEDEIDEQSLLLFKNDSQSDLTIEAKIVEEYEDLFPQESTNEYEETCKDFDKTLQSQSNTQLVNKNENSQTKVGEVLKRTDERPLKSKKEKIDSNIETSGKHNQKQVDSFKSKHTKSTVDLKQASESQESNKTKIEKVLNKFVKFSKIIFIK